MACRRDTIGRRELDALWVLHLPFSRRKTPRVSEVSGTASQSLQLRRRARAAFDAHTYRWSIAFAVQTILALLTAYSAMSSIRWYIAIAFPLAAMVTYVVRWRAEERLSKAQQYLRHAEDYDWFGWPLSEKDVGDAAMSDTSKFQEPPTSDEHTYWATTTAPGPRRAIEAVQESAWWTQQIMSVVFGYAFAIAVVLTLGTFACLVYVVVVPVTPEATPAVLRAVLSVMATALVGGWIRLAADYNSAARQSETFDRRATNLLKAGNVDLNDSIRLVRDYHVARAKFPPVQRTIYARMQARLTNAWKHRKDV